MNNKRLAVLVGVLVILMLSVSAIYAQGPGDGEGREPGGKGGPRGGQRALVEEIANVTDTSAEDVIAARADGQSFNDYVTANGGDPAEVVSTVLASAEEKLSEAVANGDMTQEEAAEKLAELETRLTEAMASTDPLQRPEGRRGGKGGLRGGQRALVEEIANLTDTSAEDVIAARADGQSFNDYVTANSGDPAEVVSTVLASAEEKLSEAVANGDMTQEEADEKLAELETRLTEAMASTDPLQRPEGRGGKGGQHGFGAIQTISEAIGLDAEEIISTWQEGGTLADVITANDGDVEAVKAQIVADAAEKINEALAEGKIDQEEADEKLAELDAKVDEQLNSEFEAREGKPGPRGDRGNGPGNGDAPEATE